MKKYLLLITFFSFCAGATRPDQTSYYMISSLRKLAQDLLSQLEKRDHMNWKKHLRELEKQKKWDEAITFMHEVIEENPDDKDAYIFMNYLLMNILGYEDCDDIQFKKYRTLTKFYFDMSYAKFSEDPEYLYITGNTAVMGEWHFGIEQEDYLAMIEKAHKLEPDNPLYNENYYYKLRRENPSHPKLIAYAKLLLRKDSPIEKQLSTKGAVGEHLLEINRGWAKGILYNAQQ